MNHVEILQKRLKTMHSGIVNSVKDLSDTQLHFNPMGKGNSIAFLFWHYVRTEDLVMNMIIRKQKPVWNEKGWDVKLKMDPKSQGSGMTDEAARAVRIENLSDFLTYTGEVFSQSEQYVATLTDAELETEMDSPMGKRSLLDLISGINVDHGTGHIGEIEYIKGLQK
ncbi:MAG: DinB family protein [Desulfobacteraceae bacterium]|nr:DinB family protein [Desulfobacteraceae bacterium]MBU4002874.1 DinB family protein [Pseudomonadota bacterium]MBU4055669.1 DinB family protein [Pseudomonadota bacterium]